MQKVTLLALLMHTVVKATLVSSTVGQSVCQQKSQQ